VFGCGERGFGFLPEGFRYFGRGVREQTVEAVRMAEAAGRWREGVQRGVHLREITDDNRDADRALRVR
jgi:hypothetical protein